jgi:nucleoside-diphosphate-sugar epimerase
VKVIAVTGANGFIGRDFVRSTRVSGWTVVPLGRAELGAGLESRLRGCEAVVHLAARAHVLDAGAAADTAEFERNNVDLTRQVADSARNAGVRRIVFVSSAGVLGRASPPTGFHDDSPLAPHDAYTRSKLAAEEMLREEFAWALELVIVRPPLVYGPQAPGNFARLVGLIRRGWPLPFGALHAPRSMIGLRNLCDVLRVAVAHPQAPGLRMLVADADAPGVAELVAGIARALGRPARLIDVPQPLLRFAFALLGRSTDYQRLASPYLVRGALASERLGWTPAYRWDEELAWALQGPGPGSR